MLSRSRSLSKSKSGMSRIAEIPIRLDRLISNLGLAKRSELHVRRVRGAASPARSARALPDRC